MKNGKIQNKIRIAYDYQAFVRQRIGGITRLFYEVNSRLAEKDDFILEYPVIYSQNEYFQQILPRKELAGKSVIANYLVRLLNKFYFVKYLHRENCDIVHATYYSSYFYHFLPKKTKYVLTVYDCIQEICARNSIGNRRMKLLKKNAIRRADLLITPSINTKKDVMRLYRIPEDKICVVPLGCNILTVKQEEVKCQLPDCFVLYVGGRNDYKNFATFVRAMRIVGAKYPELRMVCVGSAFTKEERAFLKAESMEQYVIRVRADDNELNYIYQKARCFVYPSIYEGFGIPILEAFHNDCPCVLSDASCFPEVAGDAAIYFNPHSEKDMAKAVEQVITSEDLRNELIEKGRKQRALYSWETTAEGVAQVYREVIARGN